MRKIFTLALVASFATMPIHADSELPADEVTDDKTEEFMSDERLEEGFLTHYLNESIANGMSATAAADDEKPTFGRTVTKWASAPKFGGYVIGSYKYNGVDESNTFNVRLVRAYVDGTIFNDFKYRLQIQFSGTPHVKDFFIDWVHWKEFGVKIGQYKRCFTFENPYNPWDVGVGDYSQLTSQFAGMGDTMVGEKASNSATGGRDQGIQIHGDLFPISADKHRLLHYELGIYNGQGINKADANKRKDFIGTIQFQPIKNLFIGAFYWNGNYNDGKNDIDRNRLDVGVKYETTGWSARAEYAREFADNGYKGADAMYATVGIPCTPWLKTYVKYDGYNATGNWEEGNHIFSVAPNFQLHKNLMFQVQYNCVYKKNAAKETAHQFWVETYFRF